MCQIIVNGEKVNVCVSKAEIQSRIEARLLARSDANFANKLSAKAMNDECAFLAGAATALQAVFGDPGSDELTGMVPPMFILGPLTGRSVVVELKRKAVKS